MTDGTNTQYSKPEGEEGRLTLEHMNEHHARLWDFCLSHMPKAMDGSVLDVGCGGGGFIRKLSERYPYALFYGLDISEESVGMTLELNSDLVDQGALKATVGDVCGIPYADASFDMVTAMETYFFWPDLEKGMSEAHRVLSEGGMFVIGSEMQANPGDEAFMEESLRECGCRLRYDSDIIAMMETAGFSVRTFSVPEERWVVFVGRRSERERR
ncbi:MAG: class I SAM-dependent methyltransferase [Candidatus Methanomethylophilaceae archaeon]|nr:class I SAM-dependent methyltransferase [Thermoplasmata archaeon]MBQ3686030.1 class I SAM-dependent methyltransferase [Candidatus Methanomethylophilaceae archaeon]